MPGAARAPPDLHNGGWRRNHRRMPDGSLRDTVVFSILDAEWPAVRSGLRYRLARAGA